MLKEALFAGELERRPVFGGPSVDQLALFEALELGGFGAHERERKLESFADFDPVVLRALNGPQSIGRHNVEIRRHAVAAPLE